MDNDTRALLERGIAALEKLAEDPQIEIEAGPPVCPHCQAFNPSVQTDDAGDSGPLLEFFMKVKCLECQHDFYAIPMTWHCVIGIAEVEEEMVMRNERLGN